MVVEDGYPISEVAARFQCSWPTVKRWVDRYLDGDRSMRDRSSRPHTMPAKTAPVVTKRLVSLGLRLREGPVQLAARCGVAPSTAHRILVRCRVNRLAHVDRATGEPVRRYEHPHPGSMIHVDVKKLGNIPDGGGWRYVGRQQGRRNRAATLDKTKNRQSNPKMGHAFVHTVIDDHSRVGYAEVHDDERAATAVAVLRRAVAWFTLRGVTVERVLSDNGSAYRSFLWRDRCAELGITPKRTRPYRPQTNGKIERFHRTMADGWAYARHYDSEEARRAALPAWLHAYNHHRPHSACESQPPFNRLTNVPGQYTVVEVVSPGSFETDAITKRAEYARAGIPAYLLVDVRGPRPTVVLFDRIVDGAYATPDTDGTAATLRIGDHTIPLLATDLVDPDTFGTTTPPD